MIDQLTTLKDSHFNKYNFDFIEEAKKVFQSEGIPTRKNESWRNTNLKTWWDKTSTWKELDISSLQSNKIILSQNFKSTLIDKGINIHSLEELMAKKDLFNRFKEMFKDKDSIFNLGLSCLEKAIFIEVESNTAIKHPIEVVHEFDDATDVHHIFVLINQGSKATLIEQNNSALEQNHFSHQYFLVDENANLEHINLQTGINKVINFTRAQVSKFGFYKNIFFNFTALLSRNDVKVDLMQEGADCHAYGLYTLSDNQHCDNSTLINHYAARTYATQLYKGMIDDNGHGIFTGKVFIHPDAQQVESNQLNKNLLLSKKAHAQSQPQLEVFADDVKCAHGSTTGQLSDDELFYFLSRGLSPKKAKTLLSHAFCNDIVMKISSIDIQTHVSDLMEQKFATMAHVHGENQDGEND